MIKPIGRIVSPYKDKFGVARQPHLVKNLRAQVEIPFSQCPPEAFSELTGFNFIWLICYFHQAKHNQSKVRPPRLGGNKRIGVFATRSPFRPNPIALSLVKLEKIEIDQESHQSILHVQGIDLIDETPILDIKPYIKNHDTPWEEVTNGWLENSNICEFNVRWSEKSLQDIQTLKLEAKIIQDIEDVLRWDPRPAFHQDDEDRLYHCRLNDYDIHFSVLNDQVLIKKINFYNR